VDNYEETMYNALLGSVDLDGKHFYYTNPLDARFARSEWHTCPCCVGNIPRTLLMVPTWTYAKAADGVYVNMYIGSTIMLENAGGKDVAMVQKTDYPWSGKIALTVNPKTPVRFTVRLRVPNRATSKLYTPNPGQWRHISGWNRADGAASCRRVSVRARRGAAARYFAA
jgi:DUF1680 family protein